MGAEKRLLSVKEAFQLAQQPHQNQAKLVVALSRTYGTAQSNGVQFLFSVTNSREVWEICQKMPRLVIFFNKVNEANPIVLEDKTSNMRIPESRLFQDFRPMDNDLRLSSRFVFLSQRILFLQQGLVICNTSGNRGCTISGSTAIPDQCREWMEQAAIPSPISKNPFKEWIPHLVLAKRLGSNNKDKNLRDGRGKRTGSAFASNLEANLQG